MERALGIVAALGSGLLVAWTTGWALNASLPLSSLHVTIGVTVAFAAIAMAVAIGVGSVRGRCALVAVALLCVPALWLADALELVRLGEVAGETGPIRIVFGVGVVVTAVGLLQGRVWARWLAFAGGTLGLLSNGINGIGSLSAPSIATWGHGLALSCCGLLYAGLWGTAVRDRFEHAAHTDPLWRQPDALVRGLRWTVLTNLAAAAMLLVYAWTQPVVPQTQPYATGLAVVLVAGAVLTVLRKTAGALVATIGGAALLVLTAATCMLANTGQVNTALIVAYYACFWVPAGVVSTVTGVSLARRLRA